MRKPILALLLALTTVTTMADDTQDGGGFSDALVGALRSLSGFLPQPDPEPVDKDAAVATIGVRGAESTATLINPYWKDDLTRNDAFREQLTLLNGAVAELQSGRYAEAATALDGFAVAHADSSLLPAARFARALAAAGAGNTDEARDRLRQFRNDYPDHPLAGRSEALSAALR